MERCPCCRKKTDVVLGPLLNRTPPGFCNFMDRPCAARLARASTCPWCGRETTTPARTLLQRFDPTQQRNERV